MGAWARVEGTPDDPNPNKPFAKMENSALFNNSGQLNPSITILGSNVAVPGEVSSVSLILDLSLFFLQVIILNSIVLPHKELGGSYKNQIIL